MSINEYLDTLGQYRLGACDFENNLVGISYFGKPLRLHDIVKALDEQRERVVSDECTTLADVAGVS